eukprot:CAMPEP_0202695580 /NCGR_PEP_ID=MMETSP1385-20130828/9144_1 /ASSEMBLY_ACC=CAM_ASM_000861 /TAXON_ID=933848 /ORGANISM="Elphidium margaritaceum" /LENGTH=737 /DNA_ID=CAMNT_0049351637 /DNA_START=77 /DNA_END=2290 /DNA_ORIENTATION=-
MNQDSKIREYTLKRQQQRERAERLRNQRKNGVPGNSGASINENSNNDNNGYGSRNSHAFSASKRIIGDPFGMPANNENRDLNAQSQWNDGRGGHYDSHMNPRGGCNDSFDKFNQHDRGGYGGNTNSNNHAYTRGNQGYNNPTPFAKRGDAAYSTHNVDDDNFGHAYNQHSNHNNAGGNNNWQTPLPKPRGNDYSGNFDRSQQQQQQAQAPPQQQSVAYRGNTFGGADTRGRLATVPSQSRNMGNNRGGIPFDSNVVDDGYDGGSQPQPPPPQQQSYARSQSSENLAAPPPPQSTSNASNPKHSSAQYATASDVKKVLAMVEQLRGQMHALQFQIDNVKLDNTKLRQHVSELEQALKQQQNMSRDHGNQNFFASQCNKQAPQQPQQPPQQHHHSQQQPQPMANNRNNFGGGQSLSQSQSQSQIPSGHHRNHEYNMNANGMRANNMEIDQHDVASNQNMRISQSLRTLKDKQNQQNVNVNDNVNGNAFEQQQQQNFNQFPDNDNGFNSNNRNNQNNHSNSNNYNSHSRSGMPHHHQQQQQQQQQQQPASGAPDEEDTGAAPPPPSSAADLLAKLEQEQDAFVDPQQIARVPCHQCGRKFAQDALQKHIRICKKVFGQKRKQFNTKHQRSDNEALQAQSTTDQAAIERELARKKEAQKKKWKAQSSMLRDAIRQSKAIEQAIKDGKPLSEVPAMQSMPAAMDDRVPCPHCGRKFAEETAKRHIPKCQNIKSRPTGIKRRK